jgi:hypothetical protein
MAKEQAKIILRRNANEERRIRYLNAPQRLIGLNSEALDAQVIYTHVIYLYIYKYLYVYTFINLHEYIHIKIYISIGICTYIYIYNIFV